MIRTIRILGAALGALIGLGIAATGTGLFAELSYAGFILAAWTIAWSVVGFALLPYLTIVPAGWLIRMSRTCRPPSSSRPSSACSSASSWGCC